MPKYKATAYIRLSYTDDHSSESDSVSNQRKLIENFVEHNPDIEVVSEKIDDGYSGIIFDRPAFKEMMQDVTDGNINCVIVKDLSRLGREYIETGRYLRRVFPAYGVRFIAITGSNQEVLTALEGYRDRNEVFDAGLTELETVVKYLAAFGVPEENFAVDLTIARGLDYYTRTVFEVEAPGAGVGSIGGGGRYDGLVELEGGKPTAGVGFAVGFERALLALQAFGSDLGAEETPCVYVANAGKELRQNVFAITQELRAAGIVTEADYQGRSLKAQFKQADKVGAKLILVLGGDELAAGKVKVRDMESHDEVLADLDNVVEAVRERL